MSDELTDETDRGVVHESRLTWFGDFNAFERPQCCVTGCKFIAERDDGAWCCWKHGRFEVEYGRSEPETTEQTTLITDGGQSKDDTERVWYDEITDAFVGETLERDGVIAEVEAVIANDDDPQDDDARYSLEVRARSVETATEQYGGRQ
jgi:hypothetical protein